MVSAYTYIIAGMNACASLPDQNSPGMHLLPPESLYTKPFGLAIPT